MERDDAYADLWFCCQGGMHLQVISTSFQILLINQFKHISSGKEKQVMLPLHTLLSPSVPICCCTSITEINQFNPDRQGVRELLLQRKVKRCSYSLSQFLPTPRGSSCFCEANCQTTVTCPNPGTESEFWNSLGWFSWKTGISPQTI